MNVPDVPLRRLFAVVNGGTPTADAENWDGDVRWATPVDLGHCNGGYLGATIRTLTESGLHTGSAAVPADSLVVSTRAPIGYVAQTTGRTAFNQGCRGLTPKVSVDTRFYCYALLSLADLIQSNGQGSTFTELSTESLASIRVPNPSFETQRAIADFLDAETARIDGLLDRKLRLVGLAQERIDAEVLEFVGRSDLARPGDGTRSLPLRRLLVKLDREADPEALMITAFRDGQVTARSLRRPDGFTESWTEGARVQGVEIGDVVVHGLDGFAGAIGTSEASGSCSPVYHVCSPSDGGDAQFYGRFLRLLATDNYLSLFAVSTRERAVDFRNWDLFGRIPVPVVNRIDQRRIGDRIRALSPFRVAVERSASLVAEHKQALISAAVTGQLDLARELAEEAS